MTHADSSSRLGMRISPSMTALVSHTCAASVDFTAAGQAEISTEGFFDLANFCPNIKHLTLNFCGRLDDEVIDHFAKRFSNLKRIELYGPYLVTSAKWKEYFSSFGTKSLEGFLLRQSPSV